MPAARIWLQASSLTAAGAALHQPAAGSLSCVPVYDHCVLGVVRERMDVLGVVVERVLHDPHPGRANLLPEAIDLRRDHTEILDDDRQVAELALDDAEEVVAGAGAPSSVPGQRFVRRDRPVRDEATEVVEAGQVEELEGPAEALDPPVVSLRGVRRPPVERVPPVLAVRVEVVGRCAGDPGRVEQLRMCATSALSGAT